MIYESPMPCFVIQELFGILLLIVKLSARESASGVEDHSFKSWPNISRDLLSTSLLISETLHVKLQGSYYLAVSEFHGFSITFFRTKN